MILSCDIHILSKYREINKWKEFDSVFAYGRALYYSHEISRRILIVTKNPIPPLQTIDGETLMSMPLEPLNFIVDSFLSQGLHILAGSPKVGKSWLALWLSVMIARGEPVWGMASRKGTTLYLCLEDSERRIQNRLLSIAEDVPSDVHFCTESNILEKGLEEQLTQFLNEHPDTVLVIIDTLQKVRGVKNDNAYANDYRDLSLLKKLADQFGVAILLVHHTRKEGDEDVFNRISGTTAISGAVDSSFLLVEEKRGSGHAKLFCIGRDIEYRELELERDDDNVWQLRGDSKLQPGGSIISAISVFLSERPDYIGTPTEFANEIDPDGSIGITPKKAARQISESAAALREFGITARVRRSNGKRIIELHRAESVEYYSAGENVPFDPDAATDGDLCDPVVPTEESAAAV